MYNLQRIGIVASFLLVALTAACAPVKTIEIWKDEAYTQRLDKVLVIAIAREDYVRKHFENVLADQLNRRGTQAVASHTVLPQAGTKLDRETVLAKVTELGIDNVLVARSISRKEVTNHTLGGAFFAPTAMYNDGWYSYYSGLIVYPERAYDTDYFTVATNLFDVDNKKPVWSYVSQIRIADERQGVINKFVPLLVQQMEESQLLK